jgi:hypothetical protein
MLILHQNLPFVNPFIFAIRRAIRYEEREGRGNVVSVRFSFQAMERAKPFEPRPLRG